MTPNRKKPVVFGRDEYHGRTGSHTSDPHEGYDSSDLEGDSAAHSAVDAAQTAGPGYELHEFRGGYYHKLSIDEIEDDEQAEVDAWEDEQDKQILSELGFGTDGSTLK